MNKGICQILGHKKHDSTLYARFSPNYHAIDGIGSHHRRLEYQCERCGEWVQLCMIHTTVLEGKRYETISIRN